MTKFGEIISVEKPVLIDFYKGSRLKKPDFNTIRNIAAALGEKVKVIKIDLRQNELLADALHIDENPTFMIYKQGEMKWRQSGEQDVNNLIGVVQQYM